MSTPVAKTRPNGQIWMEAEQFFNAAEVLFLTSNNINGYVYPLLVNYSLSVELALKSIVGQVEIMEITAEGLIPAAEIKSSIWGHKHNKLFSSLPPEIQSAVAHEFKVLTCEEIHPLLERCKDYFVIGRYAHEYIGGSFDLSGLRTLAQGVLKAANVVSLKIEKASGGLLIAST